MKKEKGAADAYFEMLDSLEDQVLKAQADYLKIQSDIAKRRQKMNALLTAAALRAMSNGEDVSTAVDRELEGWDKQLNLLNKDKLRAYLEYQRLLERLKLVSPPTRKFIATRKIFVETGKIFVTAADQAQDDCQATDFSQCIPNQITEMTLLRYYKNAYPFASGFGIIMTLPDQASVESSVPPPVLKIDVQGDHGNSNGQVWWGMEINKVGCGIQFECRSLVTGAVDIGTCDWDPHPFVDLRLGIQVYQYRGINVPFSEYQPQSFGPETPNAWAPYNEWHAFPEVLAVGDSSKSSVERTPGLHPITPFQALVTSKVCDVQMGDKFVFRYAFGVQATCSSVSLTFNNVGTLLIIPPYVIQYDPDLTLVP